METNEPKPTPEEIQQAIIQRMKSKIVFENKIARLEELRQANEAEINRLLKLL